MSGKQVATIVLVSAFVLVAVAVYLNRKAKKDTSTPTEPLICPDFNAQYSGQPNLNEGEPDFEQLVKLGDYGPNVAYLQSRLRSAYGSDIKVDGKAGCDTFYAVHLFTGLDLSEGVDLNDIK